jgi:CRISPR-associated endonuclease Cas1
VPALAREDAAEAAALVEATFRRSDTAGVCVADGFGVKVTVERGALVVHDGIGSHRRTRRYERASHGLRRLVLLRPEGFVTFEALRWCSALGVAVVVLGAKGADLVSTPRVGDDARLRRQQAVALSQPVGLGVARYLLGAKLRGQAQLVSEHFPDAQCHLPGMDSYEVPSVIAKLAGDLDGAGSVEEARQYEASAASEYFATWVGRPQASPVFVAKDRARVPPGWSAYDGRRSALIRSRGNQRAAHPTNALLNYAFALLEAEATLACQVVGLDPGLGVVHSDVKARASMALDVMEPARPKVEAFVLELLRSRPFRKAEFVELPDGQLRLRAPLTHELAEAMPQMARWVAPHAEAVAHMLGAAMEGKYEPATPLTGAKHRRAAAEVKARKGQGPSRPKRPKDPRNTGRPREPRSERAVAERLGVARGRVRRARLLRVPFVTLAEGGRTHHLNGDPDRFAPLRDALVAAGVSEAVVARACGVSPSAAWYWLAGRHTPRVRHWPALAELAGVKLVPEPVLPVGPLRPAEPERGAEVVIVEADREREEMASLG